MGSRTHFPRVSPSYNGNSTRECDYFHKEAFLSPADRYKKGTDRYDAKAMLYADTLSDFVCWSQPKAWTRLENANQVDLVVKQTRT